MTVFEIIMSIAAVGVLAILRDISYGIWEIVDNLREKPVDVNASKA